MKRIYDSVHIWQILTFFILALFVVNRAYPELLRLKNPVSKLTSFSVIEPVQASEIYPMFTCPCCDQPLNKEEPCCGAMTQMIDYIDEQTSSGVTKDGVVLATAKEFGLDRLTNEEDRLALKQQLADSAPVDASRIEISETTKDLGIVSQKQGVVSTDFKFTNQGKSDLVIDKLSSSCGCTSAAIVYDGLVGPTFAMEGHGQENPKDWQVNVRPGDNATLRVYYDPTVHPDLEGAVTRTVSIMSNDPVEFETKVTISLEQTK